MAGWQIGRIASLLVALAPACFLLWRGRLLARLKDDPALPERLFAERRGRSIAVVASVAALIILEPAYLYWTIPLLFLARGAAAYPLRRTLYGETWGVGRYLFFFTRLIAAFYGFWIVLACAPMLVDSAGDEGWLAGCTLALVLIVWHRWYVDIARFVLRTRPIEDPALTSRFDEMVAACGLPDPRLERIDLHGGAVANAVALPSLRRSAVVFSETVLARMDTDEVAAICAHELGHLEYYNPRRMRRLSVVTYALIAAGSFLPSLLRIWSPPAAGLMPAVWPMTIFAMLAARARDRQKHETASDLRAVALTVQPETVARALIKLHALARLPRRWDPEFERRATHPSLARRVQAIRAAAGTAQAGLGLASTFAATGASSSVTFGEDRLEWIEGSMASYSLAYGHLTDLRIRATANAGARLVAVDERGRRWEMPVADADVAQVQAALDAVDAKLGRPAATHAIPSSSARALAGIAALVAFGLMQVAPVVTALLAVVAPDISMVNAAGTAAIAGAILQGVLAGAGRLRVTWELDIALALCGLTLLALAIRGMNRREEARRDVSKAIAALALCTALAFALIFVNGVDPIRLHQAARSAPGAAVFPLALAAALASCQVRRLRFAAIPVTALGILAGYVGSIGFLERFGDDQFLRHAPHLTTKTVLADRPLVRASIPFAATGLEISPAGRSVAVASEDDREQTTFHVGIAGAALAAFQADAAVFVDDSRLLLLHQRPAETTLSELAVADSVREVWQHRIVGISSSQLTVNRRTNQWRLVGTDGDEGVCVRGTLLSADAEEQRWPLPSSTGVGAVPVWTDGRSALFVETSYHRTWWQRSRLLWLAPLFLPTAIQAESRLWISGPEGTRELAGSKLDVRCVGARLDGDRPLCVAYDGSRTRVFTINPIAPRLEAAAELDGRFFTYGSSSGEGWITGWWNGGPTVLRLMTGEAIRVSTPRTGRPSQLAVGDRSIGVLSFEGGRSSIAIYPFPGN